MQLTNKKGDKNKVAIRTFFDHGPIEYQDLLYKNVEIIEFYNRNFRIIESMIQVLYGSTVIWGIMIFARISLFGIDVTTENFPRFILDFFIGGYFVIWFYFLPKMRCVTTEAKLNYNRFMS